jgi:hypothetical protein
MNNNLYDQIVADRGKLQNWMSRIPGLRGYQEKGARRDADRMIREYIAGQLESRLNRFVGLEKQILQSGGMALMSQSRDAKTKFQTYIGKVKAAAPGYSGFFAAVKIGDEELERLYAFDEAQIRYLDQFDEKLDALEQAAQSGEGLEAAIQDVYNLSQEAMQAFELRDDVLTNLNNRYM